MADNVTLPAQGTGTTQPKIATDERTIESVASLHVQRGVGVGSTDGAQGQVEVSSTSTTIVAARDTRQRLLIVNHQPVPIYVDVDGGTATTSDFRVDAGASLTLLVVTAVTARTADAYTASGDAKVHYIEEYD